ncbi:MAG: ATP-binding protein [Oscillospiraceae bacterium]|nr:ATP-binding protein [Oscillospiraceae bacterium]
MTEISDRVSEIIDNRRKELKLETETRREEIFAKFPRIKEIEERLDATGIKMINCVLSGSCEPEEAVRRIMSENRVVSEEKRRILTENGYDPEYIEPLSLCEKCGDTGYIGGKICSCVKKELNKNIQSAANLSEKLSGQTFEGFRFDFYSESPDTNLGFSPRENIRSVYGLCKDFAENFDQTDKNLFFTGDCGLGKTYLSSAIANHLIANGTDVLYVSANSLFPILEDLHFNRTVSEETRYLVGHATDCELLILDDLGAEFVTPFTTAELFRILNDRLHNNKKMIISTNMDFDELKRRYSDRISSRIIGNFEVVGFFGDDIRKKMKMEGQA